VFVVYKNQPSHGFGPPDFGRVVGGASRKHLTIQKLSNHKTIEYYSYYFANQNLCRNFRIV